LDEVLNTLVERTEIIPLPLLRAEALLTVASELEHKEDLTKEKSRIDGGCNTFGSSLGKPCLI
jgi:hypothetical protein